MEADQEDFSSLSITDRLQHKSWKARVSGYEELSKFFRTCDEKEFNQYESYMKKLPLDANAAAQDTGLTTLINFVDNAPNAARTRDSVLPAVVEKCLSSSRTGTKSKAVELILLYIEVDTADPVVELVFPGLDAKQPKTIAYTVFTLKEIVRLYGCKTVTPKPILKQLPKLFGHSDKNVRDEATKLTMEIYRWLGQAITPFFADLNPIKVKELEEGFSKLPPEKPVAERLLRSQQAVVAEAAAAQEDEAAEDEKEEEVDTYDLVDPVDILVKMPADFFTNLASSKWKDRKEALDALLEVVKTPKILDNNYSELVGALGKRMTDANILCVTVAASCIEAIALGLRTAFGKYKSLVVGPMIEKLKERKSTVIEALSGALDAAFASVSFQEILEDVTTGANHKNPQVKAEIVKALSRRLKTIKEVPPKGEIKTLAEMLMKTYDDSDSGVREASAEALGTLMKVAGEKTMTPWTEKLDDIKLAKVKEFFEKAEVKAKAVVAKKPAAPPPAPTKAAAPPKKGPPKSAPPKSEDTDDKENEAPKAAPPKPKAPPKAAAPAAAKKSAPKPAATPSVPAKKGKSAPDEPLRYRFTPEDAEARTSEYIPEDILSQLASSNWKERLAGLEALYTKYESSPNDAESEIIFRALGKKPGWKESNFQVMGKVFNIFEHLASNSSSFSKACAAIAINGGMLEKLGDIKLKKAAGDCLTVFVEKTSLQFILNQAYEPWKKAKSPKVLADSLIWLHAILMDFGISGVNVRDLVEFLKTALASSNASVRTNAVTVFGALRLYIGPEVKSFVQDVNPTLLATIEAEFAKVAEMEPPKPTKQTAEGDAGDSDALDQLFPRVDIGPQLTSKLLEECNDGNWKVRKEGLEKVVAILEGANKRIKPNLGDFTGTLKARLNDSNKNLQVMTLEITAMIAIAMDKPFEKYVRIVVGPVTAVLSDNKANIRAAGITTLESFRKVCGLDPMIASFGTSLNTDNPALRKDLLTWLSECLKTDEESEEKLPDLTPLVPGVIACLQDRSADVRKGAQACLGPIISNTGYDYVISKTSDLKGAARQTVVPLIDAARPANTAKQPAPAASQEKPSKPAASTKEATAAGPKSKLVLKKNAASAIKQPASSTPTPPPEPADDLALIQTSDPKAKSARAQKDAGPMKWNIEASRKDMIDFLSQQMEGNFNAEACRLLFSAGHHADKDYINGIQMIDNFIVTADGEMKSRVIANTDLILKYMTVRFFDTNTSMLIKCLDLIDHLISLLEQEEYHMSEYEASCFLPFFVQKVGDSKEIMRQRIRGILKSMCKIYPASKMFGYIMNHGLISKNARTRSESLEELGALIQRNGISVMVAKKDLPVVALHIGDRDASVRNAAIGAVTQAYMLIGDQVLKCLGDLPDKDKSLLEERLKRTKPPPPPSNPTPANANGAASGIKPPSAVEREPGLPKPQAGGQTRLQFQRFRPPSAVPPPAQSSEVEEEDYDQRKDFSLELDKLDVPQMSNAVHTEIPAPMRGPITGLPTPQVANKSRTVAQSDSKEYMMDYIVTQITSGDAYQSIEALKHLDKILNSSPELIAPHVNELVNAITLQVRLAYSSLDAKSPALTRLCKHLVNALVLLFSNKELAITISQDALHQLLQELAHRLLDQNMLGHESGPQLSKALNVAMVKVLENSNRNATFSALLIILEKSSANLKNHQDDPMAASQAKFTELIMKCLWKLAKTIQENLKSGTLVPNVLLLDINNFFNSAPPSEWKRRAAEKVPLGEMPLRTVKTLLLEMVNGLGDEVFVKMDLISDPQRSCVYPYLHHMWEACKKKERGQYDDSKTPTPSRPSSIVSNGSMHRPSVTSRPGSPHSPMRPNVVTPDLEMRFPDRPSSIGPKPHTSESTSSTTSNSIREAEMNNLLTQIFVKIGTREQTKQGIYELYQFQKKYPNAEAKVSAHLAQTGTYFQSYIRRGLTNLAAEEAESDSQPVAEQTYENTNGHVETAISGDTQSETYKQKLARLQSMFGYRSESMSSISSTDSGHTRNVSSEYGEPISPITSSAPPLYTPAATTTAELDRAQTVSALKERLARMKSNMNHMNAVSSNP